MPDGGWVCLAAVADGVLRNGRPRAKAAAGTGGVVATLAEAPDVLTVGECARLARTGVKPIYRAIASGELYGRRIGKQIRVPKRVFIAWLEGAENGRDAPPGLRVLEATGPGRQRHRPE